MELCSLPEFGLGPNYDRGSGRNGGLLQKDLCQHAMAPRAVVVNALDPAAGHCRLTPPPETQGHSQASLAQSLVGSFLLSPGSWCAQTFVVPSKSLFTWGFSVLSPDPQAEKPVVGPRTFATVQELLWYNCSPVYGLSAQRLYNGANGDLLQEDLCHTLCLPGLLQPETLSPGPCRQVTADTCLCRRRSNTQMQV